MQSLAVPIALESSVWDPYFGKQDLTRSQNTATCVAKLGLCLNRLANVFHSLESSREGVLRGEKNLIVRVETSVQRFQKTISEVIVKFNEHAADTTVAVRALCHDRAKVLDAQTDKLAVSAGQVHFLKKAQRSGKVQVTVYPAGVIQWLHEATVVKELCKINLHPEVPTKLDILTKCQCDVVRGIQSMTLLRGYDVDGHKSTACGVGLTSCWKGAAGMNEVIVTCRDSTGNPIEWLTDTDVSVSVKSIAGEAVGRGVGAQVFTTGKITIQYEVDDENVDEVAVSVIVADVLVCGGPWLVAVSRSIINPDAVHIKTNCIDGSGNYGDAVTLDGKHVIVTSYFTHCISVYNMETGCCVCTFGSLGSGPGQFYYPNQICVTPTGTLLVSEYGNKRIQEVTTFGNHIRFIGQDHTEGNCIWGMCLHSDILAIGLYGGVADDQILLYKYSNGDLIRKFGPRGCRLGELELVRGLCFTPDGTHILVADNSTRLSLFSVDGTFVKVIGTGVLGRFVSDVLCSGSSVFVADRSNHRVCVFMLLSETNAFIRTLDIPANGELLYPTALSTYQNQLLVLDCTNSWVHVFE